MARFTPLTLLVLFTTVVTIQAHLRHWHVPHFRQRHGDCYGHDIKHIPHTKLHHCANLCYRLRNCKTFLFVDHGAKSYCWLKNYRCGHLTATNHHEYHFYNKVYPPVHRRRWRGRHRCGGLALRAGSLFRLSLFKFLKHCPPGSRYVGGHRCRVVQLHTFQHWVHIHGRKYGFRFGGIKLFRVHHHIHPAARIRFIFYLRGHRYVIRPHHPYRVGLFRWKPSHRFPHGRCLPGSRPRGHGNRWCTVFNFHIFRHWLHAHGPHLFRVYFLRFKYGHQIRHAFRPGGWLRLNWFNHMKRCPTGTRRIGARCKVLNFHRYRSWLMHSGFRYGITPQRFRWIRGYRFKHYRLLRHNLHNHGWLYLSWFRGLHNCIPGTRRHGHRCQILHIRRVLHWLRHHARHFHINVNHLPKIPNSIHIFNFNGRGPRRWRLRRRGGVRFFKRKWIYFPGGKNSRASFRRVRFPGSFTISFFLMPQRVKGKQTIIGSWVRNRWLYNLHLINGKLGLWLRRNPNPHQAMVPDVNGGHLVPNRWYHIAFTWNAHTRWLRLFVNGKQVGALRSRYHRGPVYMNPGRTALGWKQDSHNENFKGYMANLRISRGVVSRRRLIILARLIRKFKVHFGGFKYINQLKHNLRFNGAILLRWFRFGKHHLRKCPHGTRRMKYSRRYGVRCRVVHIVYLYRWLRRHAPSWHINLRRIPRPRIYPFAPGTRLMRLFKGFHSRGGTPLKGYYTSLRCRNYCASRHWCQVVDYNGQTHRCYYYRHPKRRIRATRRTCGVKQTWKVGQYRKVRKIRPRRFFLKRYTHRYGDCPGHDIAHFTHTNLQSCTQQCNIRRNCRTFLFVDRGYNSYCWLKKSWCRHLKARRVKRYHFYTKKVRRLRFRYWRKLRKNFRKGGVIHLSWFKKFRLRRCMRGTKQVGKTCRITNLWWFLRWIRRHHKRFHIPVKHFPQVPHLYHLYLFRKPHRRGRWAFFPRGGVQYFKRKALYFPGVRGAYALGKRFPKYRESFTISFFLKPLSVNEDQTLVAQWASKRWQYLFRLNKGGSLTLALRRDRFNTGSDPRQDMIKWTTGGKLVPNHWYYVGFSWDHPHGIARIYVNDKVVATAKALHPDHNLFHAPRAHFQLGYKADSNNENFKGFIAHLRFTRGVLPVRRFKFYVGVIKKFIHLHFGGFKHIKKLIQAFRKPFGRFDIRWFKFGKHVLKHCPHGSRKSFGRAAFDRYICVITHPHNIYRWLVRVAPRFHISIRKFPKHHIYRFAPGKPRVIKLLRWRHSSHGHRLPRRYTSRSCRDYCIRDRHCRAVDYNGHNHSCWLHTHLRRAKIAPSTRICQYRKVTPVRPYHPKGYNFRNGDCYGQDIKHYRGKTAHWCVHRCNRMKKCKSLLFLVRGARRDCWLKHSYCHHRREHKGDRRYHFYTKKITRFPHVVNLRKQLRPGGVIFLSWFPGVKKCWRGTKPAGKGKCKVIKMRYIFHWFIRHQKKYKFSIHWFPQITSTWHVFYFNNRRQPRRWRYIRHGHGVKVVKNKALYFPGKKNHYVSGPRFPKARGSFTIGMFIKPQNVNQQTIIAQWSKNRYQYLFRIWKGGQIGLYLRGRNTHTNMIGSLHGGKLVPNHWYYVAFSWNHRTGEAKLYLNGRAVAARKTKQKNHDLFHNPLPRWQLGGKLDDKSGWYHGYIANLEFTHGIMPTRRMIRYSRLIKKLTLVFGGFKQKKILFKNLRFGGYIILSWFKNMKKCPYGTRMVKKGKSVQCYVYNLKLVYKWLRAFGPKYHINVLKLPKIRWYHFAPGNKRIVLHRHQHSYHGKPLRHKMTSKKCRDYALRHWNVWAVDYNGSNMRCYVHYHLRKRRPATAKSTGTRTPWKVAQYTKPKMVMVVHFMRKHIKPNGYIQLWWFNQKACYPGTVKTKKGCKITKIHVFIKWIRKVAPKYKINLKKLPLNTVWNLPAKGKVYGHPWYYFYNQIRPGAFKGGVKKTKGPYGSSGYPAFYFPGKPTAYVRVDNQRNLRFKSFTFFGWIKQNGLRDGPIIEYVGHNGKGAGVHVWIWKQTLYANLLHNHGRSYYVRFPKFKGMFPKNKWAFIGVSYNHKNGNVVMWINGRIHTQHAPRFTLDTSGQVYSGIRPSNPRYRPFRGYLSGISLLPYAVTRKTVYTFNKFIFKLLGNKNVPKGFYSAPPIPKPKPPVPLLPGKFNGHPVYFLFGLTPKKSHRPNKATGPHGSSKRTCWWTGKPGYYFSAPNVHPNAFTIFTFIKQPKFQNGPIVEWAGKKGKPHGTHFWLWENQLWVNINGGNKHFKYVLKGSVPAGKWNFVGVSYNPANGILIMWVNGNIYRKNVGKIAVDTAGPVYVGSRPRNPKFHPFRGWLSGTSILPYAIDKKQLLGLRYQIVTRYFHIKSLPGNFWWPVGYVPPKPTPKPTPKPIPPKKPESPEELPEPEPAHPKPKGPTKLTKQNLKPGGIFSLTIFKGLSSCPPGTTLRNGACYIDHYQIFISWLKIHSITYGIKFTTLQFYRPTTTTTTTMFAAGMKLPINMFKGVCPSGTKTVTAQNPPKFCEISDHSLFLIWLKKYGTSYGIQWDVTGANGQHQTGGAQAGTGGWSSSGGTSFSSGWQTVGGGHTSGGWQTVGGGTAGGGWQTVGSTGGVGGSFGGGGYTTTTSSSGGFSQGAILKKAMLMGKCQPGTVEFKGDCKVTDLNKLMAALKKLGFSVTAGKKK